MLTAAAQGHITGRGAGIFPGLAIFLAVLGFNLLGDALRDALEPRLRGARATTRLLSGEAAPAGRCPLINNDCGQRKNHRILPF